MADATNKLYLIEYMVPYIAQFDKSRSKIVKDELMNEYAEIMSMLFEQSGMVEPQESTGDIFHRTR